MAISWLMVLFPSGESKSEPFFLIKCLIAWSAIIISSCGSGDGGNRDQNSSSSDLRTSKQIVGKRGDIYAENTISVMTKQKIDEVISAKGFEERALYSIEVIKISYWTVDAFGEPIIASGTLVFPHGLAEPAPLLSSHHGTAIDEDAVASNSPAGAFSDFEGLLFGSAGYITILPDYLGFGDSAETTRPYLYADSYATTVVDLLRAVTTFCSKRDIPLNGQLFLEGYSEGGYATMAVHKLIERDYSSEFKITASAPMAGPYDLYETVLDIVENKKDFIIIPILIMCLSYENLYMLDLIDDMFLPTISTIIGKLLDGTMNEVEIAEKITLRFDAIFRPEFLASFLDGGEEKFKDAIKANCLCDWKPLAPIRLIHCVEDETVPFFNSEAAYRSFLSLGADGVSLAAKNYGDHITCYPKAVLDAKDWFDSLNPQDKGVF